MNTAEICLLIMALYTLVLLIIAARYSTRTIETLGELVHQLIDKIDAHNEAMLRDIRVLITTISGKSESVDDDEDKRRAVSKSEVESDMQYLYENFKPATWTSIERKYEPVEDKDEVSKTTVINPYDEKQ